jgi:DNA-binding CsgD family transcriptional regulator
VQAQFKLTGAELHLAESLLNGVGLEEHAKRRRTSIHTVRTQSKSLLAKTGCSRQARLLPLLYPYTHSGEAEM